MCLRLGIVQVEVSAPEDKVRALLTRSDFDQAFVECTGFEQTSAVIQLAGRIRAVLQEQRIVKYEPIIVSIAAVPSPEKNRVVLQLQRHDLPSVALSYSRYLDHSEIHRSAS